MRSAPVRCIVALMALAFGWFGAMLFLRAVHPWAYETEFRAWAIITGEYSALLWLLFGAWIAAATPGLATPGRIAGSLLGLFLASTVVPILLVFVTGGASVILLTTGQAYIVSAIAAIIYIWIAAAAREPGADQKPKPTLNRTNLGG